MSAVVHVAGAVLAGSLLLLLVAALSLLTWQRLRLRGFLNHCIVFLFAAIFYSVSLAMVLGLVGLLSVDGVIIVCSVALLIVLMWEKNYLRMVVTVPELLRRLKQVIVKDIGPLVLAIILFLPLAVRTGFHAVVLPPYIYDTLTYHLPKVADWIQQGRLVMVPTNIDRAFWPANFELMQVWYALFVHHDALIELAGVPFMLLALLCVMSMARSFGLTVRQSLLTGVIYAYTPALLANVVSAKNDIAVVALYFFMAVVFLQTRMGGTDYRRSLVLLFMAFCLALGTKASIVFILPGLGILAAWSWFGRTNRVTVHKEAMHMSLGAIAALFLLSLLIGGYWYVRNYVLFENPFHPADFYLGGRLIFGEGNSTVQQGSFSLHSMVENLRMLTATKLWDRTGQFSAELCGMAGWGWFAVGIGLPSALWALFLWQPFKWLLLSFLLSLLLLFAWVTPDPWNMRFAFWFPAVLAIAFMGLQSRLRYPCVRLAMIGLASGCAILNVVGSMNNAYFVPSEWARMMKMPLAERSVAAMAGGEYAVVENIVPKGETLAYDVHPDGWIYPFYGADFARRVEFVELDTNLYATLKRKNIRYFYTKYPPKKALRERGVSMDVLIRHGKGVYELAP